MLDWADGVDGADRSDKKMQRANQEFKLRGTDMCSPRRSLRTSAPVIEDVGNGIVREPRLDNATMATPRICIHLQIALMMSYKKKWFLKEPFSFLDVI